MISLTCQGRSDPVDRYWRCIWTDLCELTGRGGVRIIGKSKPLNESNHIFSKPFLGRDLLTERERAVLDQIVKGATSREAAHALGISHRTVEFHRANILQKLGAKNTIDLVGLVLGSR